MVDVWGKCQTQGFLRNRLAGLEPRRAKGEIHLNLIGVVAVDIEWVYRL